MSQTFFPFELFRSEETPFYYYDLHLLDRTLQTIREASDFPGFHVHYALKANSNPEILRRIASFGFGADTVSLGEIRRALDTGFPARKIVFAGVGKTDSEIREAIATGVGCLNVESEAELDVIMQIAGEMKMPAPVALRINPDIDAHTHHYITTGLAENKFGIAMDMMERIAERCAANRWIDFRGLHFHIGSQITDLTPYRILCQRIMEFQHRFPEIELHSINVGGGLGIDYDNPDSHPVPRFQEYFNIFKENLPLKQGQTLHFELGRAVVGQCGSLISRVLYVKKGVGKQFVILDAGMTDLIRPALYQARHKIQNLSSVSDVEELYDVVGPVCESSDTFASGLLLPTTARGDIIAIRSAGAYGEVMSSVYNLRGLPRAVFSR